MLNKLIDKKGEGYIDIAVFVLVMVIFISFIVRLIPAFIVKDQLNTLADQILRGSEVQGQININYTKYQESVGIIPDNVIFEATVFDGNKVQLSESITVICAAKVDIGLFGEFASFPVNLTGKATGRSEVYWK